MGLDGPSREIQVEPVRLPAVADPKPEERPAPAVPVEPEKVPA